MPRCRWRINQRCADGGRVRGLTPVRRDFENPRTSADGIWREFAVADGWLRFGQTIGLCIYCAERAILSIQNNNVLITPLCVSLPYSPPWPYAIGLTKCQQHNKRRCPVPIKAGAMVGLLKHLSALEFLAGNHAVHRITHSSTNMNVDDAVPFSIGLRFNFLVTNAAA